MDRLSDAGKFLATRSSFLLRPCEQGDNGVWQQFYDLYANLTAPGRWEWIEPDEEQLAQDR